MHYSFSRSFPQPFDYDVAKQSLTGWEATLSFSWVHQVRLEFSFTSFFIHTKQQTQSAQCSCSSWLYPYYFKYSIL